MNLNEVLGTGNSTTNYWMTRSTKQLSKTEYRKPWNITRILK